MNTPGTRWKNTPNWAGSSLSEPDDAPLQHCEISRRHLSLHNEKASIPSRELDQCRRTYDTGFQEMVNLAAEAARTHQFDEKALRLTLAEIASRSYGECTTVNQALKEGWKQGRKPLPDYCWGWTWNS